MSNNQKIASLVKNLQTDANGNTIGIITGNVLASSISTQSANLGAVDNLKIAGGSPGYYLKTDGTGNLDWQPQTPSLPGGSNTTVQYNLGGTLTGDDNFRFTPEDNTVRVDNLSAVGNVVFTGSTTLGPVANISISGGSNGQVLTTDGAGDLSWTDGGAGSVKQVDTSGSGLGFTLTGGPITDTGTVTLGVPSEVVLRSSLNIGTVANISLNGNGNQYLAGNGQWLENITGDNLDVNGVPVVPTNNRINFQNSDAPQNAINFEAVGSNIQAEINPTTPLTIDNQITAQSFKSVDIVNGNSVTFRAYETVGNQVYDLPNSYPQANLQVLAANLIDNGISKTTWINLQAAQPGINFTVFQSGNGQQFINANLATFTSNLYAAVFKNGILLRPSEYDITGTTLIVNTPLDVNDTIDVLPTSGSMAGGTGGGGGGGGQPVGLNGQLQYNDNGQFGASQAMSFDITTGVTSLTKIQSNLVNALAANVTDLYWEYAIGSNANINVANIPTLTSNVITANSSNIVTGNITTVNSNLVTANTVSSNTVTTPQLQVSTAANITGNLTVSGTTQVGVLNGVTSTFTNSITVVQTANLNNVTVTSANIANATVTGTLVANVLDVDTVTMDNLSVTGQIQCAGNITGLNLVSQEQVVATGNISGSNLVTAGALFANLDSYFNNDIYVNGNLNVTGNINTTDLSNVTIANATIALGTGDTPPLTVNDGKDRGILLYYFDDVANTQKIGFSGFDLVDREMVFASDVQDSNGFITYNQLANARANYFVGNLKFGTTTIEPSNANVEFTVADNSVTITDRGFTGNIVTDYIAGTNTASVMEIGNCSQVAITSNLLTLTKGVINTPNVANVFISYNSNVSNIFMGRGNTTTRIEGNLVIQNTANLANLRTANLLSTGVADLGAVSNVKITGGANGQTLVTDGTGNLSFSSVGAGTVTSVGVTATGNGLSVSGSPITSNGVIQLENTGVTSIDGITRRAVDIGDSPLQWFATDGNIIFTHQGTSQFLNTNLGIQLTSATNNLKGGFYDERNFNYAQVGGDLLFEADVMVNGTADAIVMFFGSGNPNVANIVGDTAGGGVTVVFDEYNYEIDIYKGSTLVQSSSVAMDIRSGNTFKNKYSVYYEHINSTTKNVYVFINNMFVTSCNIGTWVPGGNRVGMSAFTGGFNAQHCVRQYVARGGQDFAYRNFISIRRTETFNHTGTLQTWTAPVGVTEVDVTLAGAAGAASSANTTNFGGEGAIINTVIPVSPGTTYYLVVGGQTRLGNLALPSYGGGGSGGGFGTNPGIYPVVGGAGGGMTGIFLSTTIDQANCITVAGGGGGSSAVSSTYKGGDGGYLEPGSGFIGGDGSGTGGGGGATTSSGGAAGTGSLAQVVNPTSGTQLQGGNGGFRTGTGTGYGGGGGGAGYWGGGGGWSGGTDNVQGGGGGGSSYSTRPIRWINQQNTGDGYLVLRYTRTQF